MSTETLYHVYAMASTWQMADGQETSETNQSLSRNGRLTILRPPAVTDHGGPRPFSGSRRLGKETAPPSRQAKVDSTAKTLHLDREADLYAAIALASWR
jgi:hypothetical protein